MDIVLNWTGPFSFTSEVERSLLQNPEGEHSGIYCWGVRTHGGLLPHYVGETGSSFARRHVEHFEEYARGTYSTRDADAFTAGREIILFEGPLWKKEGWRLKQPFIDNFAELSSQVAKTLDLIELYVAPLEAERRIRRRIEGAIVDVFYSLPEEHLGLFPLGLRVWRRQPSEAAIRVTNLEPPSILGFPDSFEA